MEKNYTLVVIPNSYRRDKNHRLNSCLGNLELFASLFDRNLTLNICCTDCLSSFCCVCSEQPSIITHPIGVTIREGQNMTLFCNASGNPVPTISWTIHGHPVNTSHNPRISFSDDKKQLIITNVSRTDSGEYQCVARNRVGNDTSNASIVDVQCKSCCQILIKFNIHSETFSTKGYTTLPR